jgi:multiple antibiotic resistance protein
MAELFTDLEFLVLAITSVLAIMNPVSTAAVYSALTEETPESDRKKLMKSAMKLSLAVLIFFALTGQFIFSILGLTLPAFKIAGGILLIGVAFSMLNPKMTEYSPDQLENIAVVPLAFPLTCGAGTITTVILLTSEAGNIFQLFSVYMAVVFAILVSYLAMNSSHLIFRFIGQHEMKVIPRLMAVFVLAIAVQFIINGTGEALPQILSTGFPGFTGLK